MSPRIGTGSQLIRRLQFRIADCPRCHGNAAHWSGDGKSNPQSELIDCAMCAHDRSTLPVVKALVRQLQIERAVVQGCIRHMSHDLFLLTESDKKECGQVARYRVAQSRREARRSAK